MPGIYVSLMTRSRSRLESSIMVRGNFASTIPGMDVPCCMVSLMSSGQRPNDVMDVLYCSFIRAISYIVGQEMINQEIQENNKHMNKRVLPKVLTQPDAKVQLSISSVHNRVNCGL